MTNLYELQNHAFDYVTIFTYILYIVIALGLSATAPTYLTDLLFYTKMYVSLFLIYRFNPLRFVKFTPLDAKIAFNAGIFLLFTTAINSVLVTYINFFKDNVQLVIDKFNPFL
jgi:hypothetical protein